MEATAREVPRTATGRPPLRPLGILDRFVLRELVPPFLFGILAFLSLLVGIDMLFDMLKLMVREQFTWGEIGLVFAYGLPARIVWTLPMATLLACLYTFNRLSGDGEIVALQAGGIGFVRIHAPAIAFALVASFFTYWLNDRVVPASNVRAKELTLAHRNRGVVKEHVVFFMPEEGPPERIVYARTFSYEKEELTGLVIFEFFRGRLAAIVETPRARWIRDSWVMDPPRFYTPQHYEILRPPSEARVDHIGQTPREIAQKGAQPSEMTRRELWAYMERLRADGVNVLKVVVPLEIQYHMRFSVPFACLGFALIGAPLGVRRMRASAGVSIGLSILICFSYYVLFNVVTVFGQRGTISPVMTAWLPNIILATFGVGLTAQAAR